MSADELKESITFSPARQNGLGVLITFGSGSFHMAATLPTLEDSFFYAYRQVTGRRLTSADINLSATEQLSRAQRAADAVTEFSGSWKFVIGLSVITAGWVFWNRGNGAFDPYPWLMLNSILTVVSTFQSPLIMMSQNRQIDRDKQAAEMQAKFDRELVQGLHEKLDALKLAAEGAPRA